MAAIRVLHVITRMVKGGAQENTLATAAGIHGAGWDSALVTGPAVGPEGSLEPECLAAGVRMLRIPELVREVSPRADLVALRRLTALIRKEAPHIVHTHTSKAGVLGRMAARKAGVPAVVHTPHGHVFHSYGGRLKTELFIRAERACAGMADRLIALTETELREHLDLGIGRPESWVTVHSGIDFAPFEACRGSRNQVRAELGLGDQAVAIGTVGRLVPIKGQAYLLEAFSRLAAARPDLHLVLIGDGELRDALVRQARASGLRVLAGDQPSGPSQGGSVHFLGLRHDVPRLLPALDLFVLPSLNEGMGRVLVEAMAVELPCVASRVSGIPDVVDDGVTGVLVPPRDPESLAEAIGSLIADPVSRREMGRRGRLRAVPGYSRECMLQKLEHLYREVLIEKGIAPPERAPRTSPVPAEQ